MKTLFCGKCMELLRKDELPSKACSQRIEFRNRFGNVFVLPPEDGLDKGWKSFLLDQFL